MAVIIATSYWCRRCYHSFVPLLVTLTYSSKTVHRARQTFELLQRETPKFIAPDLWPTDSTDLNLIDYRIWGVIQECVYQTPVRDVTDLKQRLTNTRNGLSQSIVDDADDEWRKRLMACLKKKEDISNICCNNWNSLGWAVRLVVF